MRKIKEDRIRFSHRRNRSKKTAWFHPDRYRLCVYRSNMNIEAQIIDDFQGNTLISSSSKDKSLAKEIGFKEVASGPLVRSSYRADKVAHLLQNN